MNAENKNLTARRVDAMEGVEARELEVVEGGVADRQATDPLPWCTTGMPRDIYGRVILPKPVNPPIW